MLKTFLIGFGGAVVAAVVLFTGYTAYVDHTLVRALVGIEQQREAASHQPQVTPPSR